MNYDLREAVERAVQQAAVEDIHTHLYAPAFGDLLLFGIDELLTYHYLIAEAFRYLTIPYETFWALSKTERADIIWQQIFVQHTPISEACRGVLTTLNRLGLDANERDLNVLRKYFQQQNGDDFTTRCMEIAGVKRIAMTNSPFDEQERAIWEKGYSGDERFACGLRLDPLLLDYESSFSQLQRDGFDVQPDLSGKSLDEIRRFLNEWTQRMKPLYAMVSLPPQFQFPANDLTAKIIEGALLPHCREHNLPMALMMGVTRQVNPQLEMAGDGVGRADLNALRNLCAQFPENKFLVTVLARENQHELCVLARKFHNLHVFGCWWFINVPSLIEETTRMRLELIGPDFTAQHSDARVVDQIIYKWDHSRKVIAKVLAEKYDDLAATGWKPTVAQIEADAQELLGGAFHRFLKN